MHDAQQVAEGAVVLPQENWVLSMQMMNDARPPQDFAASETDCLTLPTELDGTETDQLLRQCQDRLANGQALTIEGEGVSRIGTPALQVLAAAQRAAQKHRLTFSILKPSPAFRRACAETGLLSLCSPPETPHD
ncbi:MAG TPA: hypothetical protein DCL48_11540 [Alphaproteobacteria bacterium]|nr:hypothetical protein [Alphaproteobacteria bacterium]